MSEDETKGSANKDNYLASGRKLIAEIQQRKITITNFQEQYSNIKSTISVLEAAISNLQSDYNDKLNKINAEYDVVEKDPTQWKDFLPKQISNLQVDAMNILQKVIGYKSLQQELSQLAYTQFADLVVATKAMETQSNLLKEMRDIDERRNTLFLLNTKVVVDNCLRVAQKIADTAFTQSRDMNQVLVEQNSDSYTFLMELIMRLRENQTLPAEDIKDLTSMAKRIKIDFAQASKLKTNSQLPDLKIEDAPEVPELPSKKVVEPVKQTKKSESMSELDFDSQENEE